METDLMWLRSKVQKERKPLWGYMHPKEGLPQKEPKELNFCDQIIDGTKIIPDQERPTARAGD